MRRFTMAMVLLIGVIGLLGAQTAFAAPACAPIANPPTPHLEQSSEKEPVRLLPVGGYTLALIWMPEKCRTGDDVSCAPWRGNLKARLASSDPADRAKADLTLHGLWPDGRGKDWPQYCKPADLLPAATIAAHICATPSPQLLQHEWAKHGTCMAGYTPDRYFDLSNRLFADMHVPKLWALSYRRQTADGIAKAFAAANSGMTGDMLRLNINKKGWLEEFWICLDTDFHPQRCPITQGGAKGEQPVKIWRGGAARAKQDPAT